jgi:hypothetical protein
MALLLLLSPQPRDTSAIDNRKDAATVGARLQQLRLQQQLTLEEKLQPRWVDMPFYLTQLRPALVHFSGHGMKLSDLVFVDDVGNRHNVPPDAVNQLFAAHSTVGVRGIVLNTCYSRAVAEQLISSVDFVVSTATELQDESAVRFAETFYPLFAAGESLKTAFESAVAQVLSHRRGTQDPPTLLLRPGIAADQYFLEGKPRPDSRPICIVHNRHSSEDHKLAQELFTQLRAAKIPFWDESQIGAGSNTKAAREHALERAALCVALISADWQADEECQQTWKLVLKRQHSGLLKLVPVRLRPSGDSEGLDGVEHFPAGKRALSQYKDRAEQWVKLVAKLRPKN